MDSLSATQILGVVIALVHAGASMYIVGGLGLIVVGDLCKWHWTKNLFFRHSHLGLIAFVTWRSALGLPCPLTILEQHLQTPRTVLSIISFRDIDQNVFLPICALAFLGAFLLWLSLVLKPGSAPFARMKEPLSQVRINNKSP